MQFFSNLPCSPAIGTQFAGGVIHRAMALQTAEFNCEKYKCMDSTLCFAVLHEKKI